MARQMSVRCANCGNQFGAVVETLVDAGRDPEAKLRLLSGALNAVQCPNCGYQMAIGTPILYHDASKELLISFVPMELNLSKDQQEKAIGDMMKELTSSIPQNQFKGYLFQPRGAFTMQGLIEQILQADGVTPEMIESQKSRAKLIEQLIQTPDHALAELVKANDAQIDATFFQTMTLMAQRLAGGGATEAAQRIIEVQNAILPLTTFGQQALAQQREQEEVVESIAREIEDLGEEADRPEFLALARKYAGDELRLRALVGLVRPVFDYTFFEDLTNTIGKSPAAEREGLEVLRDTLMALTQEVDQQSQQALRQAAQLLQQIVNSPDIDAAIRDYAGLIDGTFLSVLEANLQQAQRGGDQALLERLAQVYERVSAYIEDTMPPALRFINELLASEDDEASLQLLNEHAADYANELLPTMDAVENALAQRGDSELLSKLVFLRAQAERVLS